MPQRSLPAVDHRLVMAELSSVIGSPLPYESDVGRWLKCWEQSIGAGAKRPLCAKRLCELASGPSKAYGGTFEALGMLFGKSGSYFRLNPGTRVTPTPMATPLGFSLSDNLAEQIRHSQLRHPGAAVRKHTKAYFEVLTSQRAIRAADRYEPPAWVDELIDLPDDDPFLRRPCGDRVVSVSVSPVHVTVLAAVRRLAMLGPHESAAPRYGFQVRPVLHSGISLGQVRDLAGGHRTADLAALGPVLFISTGRLGDGGLRCDEVTRLERYRMLLPLHTTPRYVLRRARAAAPDRPVRRLALIPGASDMLYETAKAAGDSLPEVARSKHDGIYPICTDLDDDEAVSTTMPFTSVVAGQHGLVEVPELSRSQLASLFVHRDFCDPNDPRSPTLSLLQTVTAAFIEALRWCVRNPHEALALILTDPAMAGEYERLISPTFRFTTTPTAPRTPPR